MAIYCLSRDRINSMLNKEAIRRLKEIYSPGDISDQPEDLMAYGFDATGEDGTIDLVVFPTTPEQVSQTLAIANIHDFPVTARGAGTGFVGASIPLFGGVQLVMTRMNKLLHIDHDNLTALVEPGLVLGRFQEEVERLGFFYPPDPASLNSCTLGGNVAMGSGGPRAVKYGVTRDYVLGLEIVLPTGEIMNVGAETVKSVVGYDLTRLLVGSEGTLGIVTKIRLRLLPLPESTRTILIVFKTAREAVYIASQIIKNRIIPSTLEFMDHNCIMAVEKLLRTGLPIDAGALLLIETDGSTEAANNEINEIKRLCEGYELSQVRVAKDEKERAMLWEIRRSLSQAIKSISPTKINEDITVPRSKIPELIDRLSALSDRIGQPIVNFGHAGDGNIHVNIMTDKSIPARYETAKEAINDVFSICLSLGGTLSGEHGIGISKSNYIESEIGELGVLITKKIKRLFDPNNILNPGKITPLGG